MVVNIEDKLYKGIQDYCSLNDLKIGKFINELLEKQFRIEKFGSRPFFNGIPERIVNEPQDNNTVMTENGVVETVKRKKTKKEKPEVIEIVHVDPPKVEIVAEPKVAVEEKPIEKVNETPKFVIVEEEPEEEPKKKVIRKKLS